MTIPTDAELLPCPFCGATAHFEIDDDRWEWVECESCGMQGNRSASLMEDCKPKLREEWNRRAPQAGAWRDYAEHMERCRTCAEDSVGACDEGARLKVDAMAAQPPQAVREPRAEWALQALVAAGFVVQAKVDEALALYDGITKGGQDGAA